MILYFLKIFLIAIFARSAILKTLNVKVFPTHFHVRNFLKCQMSLKLIFATHLLCLLWSCLLFRCLCIIQISFCFKTKSSFFASFISQALCNAEKNVHLIRDIILTRIRFNFYIQCVTLITRGDISSCNGLTNCSILT